MSLFLVPVSETCECVADMNEELRLLTTNGSDRQVLRTRYVVDEGNLYADDQELPCAVECWLDTETPLESLQDMDVFYTPCQPFLDKLLKELLHEQRTAPLHVCYPKSKTFWDTLVGVLGHTWGRSKQWFGCSRHKVSPSAPSTEETPST